MIDFPLFRQCLELYFQEHTGEEMLFKAAVGEVFLDRNLVTTDERRTTLQEDFGAIDEFKPKTTDLSQILRNLKSHGLPNPRSVELDNGIALAYLTLTMPKYEKLRTTLDNAAFSDAKTLDDIIDEFRLQASLDLGCMPQPDLTDAKVDQSYNNQILHYAYKGKDRIPVLGREKEQSELQDFLKADEQFLWLQIAGAAGQGKSRLAWELVVEARNDLGFDAGIMGQDELANFSKYWHVWKPDRPKLIVIDYVTQPGKLVGPLLAMLMARGHELGHEVRLILVERQRWDRGATDGYISDPKTERRKGRAQADLTSNLDKEVSEIRAGLTEESFTLSLGRSAWFETLRAEKDAYGEDRSSKLTFSDVDLVSREFQFQQNALLELEPLKKEKLTEITRRVARTQNGDKPINYSDKFIEETLVRFDNAGRPLYAFFLGLSLADGRFQKAWTRGDLLTDILGIYSEKRWSAEFLEAAPGESADIPAIHLAVAATVVRALTRSALTGWPTTPEIDDKEFREALTLVGAPVA
ncbi:hypothetical protein, partial [Pseudophaeobacter sp.]|uniref:hypothetical protein n=1 Tax=Pseudophaeobacter sp. TaxID=1971739 RepID=UPI002625E47C